MTAMLTATVDMVNTIGKSSGQMRADFGDQRFRDVVGLTKEDIRTQVTIMVHTCVGQVIAEMVRAGVERSMVAQMVTRLGMWGVHIEWDDGDTETVIVPLDVMSIGQSSVTHVMYVYFNQSFKETP